jgi:peptide/nickel transport system permease protein
MEAERQIQEAPEPLQEWEQELARVGWVRRALMARRWYGPDWWFVLIGGVIVVFLMLVAIFPQWFAPYDPNANVGPRNLAPGEKPAVEVLVSRSDSGVESLRDLATGQREAFGVVVGTPSSEIARSAAEEVSDEVGTRIRLRIVRFDTLEAMVEAVADGSVRAGAASNVALEEVLGDHPDVVIQGTLEGAEATAATSFILGTNQLGQDVLSRLIWGTRVAFLVGFAAATFALLIGLPLGLISGFTGGKIDRVISLVMDSIYSFPGLVLAIAIAAVLGASVFNVVVAIAVVYIPTYYRIVRGQTLAIKEAVYVEAARSIGARAGEILRRYIFPNVIPSVAIIFSVNVADAILTGAGLSFLGLGLPPDVPDWGIDLARGQAAIQTSWWLVTFPGLAVMFVVLTLTMLGEGLVEIINPRLRDR